MLFLSSREVQACAPEPLEMLRLVEGVLLAHARKQAQHYKIHLDLRERHRGHFAAFPAYIDTGTEEGPIAGVKWLANFVDNPVRTGLPAVTALIILNDLDRGVPLVVMEGGYITALRTAAASAVGAKYLAPGRVGTIAIVGASAQGREHLRIMSEVFRPELIRVFDVRTEMVRELVEAYRPKVGPGVSAAESCEEAVEDADVVVLATSAREPFFHAGWCRPGMLVIAISGVQDLMPAVLDRVNRFVVDVVEGDEPPGALGLRPFFAQGLLSLDRIDTTVAEILSGAAAGRNSEDDIILYSPGGLGTEDLVTAKLIYERALQRRIGTRVPLL